MAAIIEIINNTRGGIEDKIGERGVWGKLKISFQIV